VGIVGYTSQKLYGPDDKDGTKLLAPGQDPINVLGEAFGAVRVLGQTITGYRQLINRPFINPQDNRMVPNTFEAYTLTGAADEFSYTGGYITKMKARQSESFVRMSNSAGATGKQEGVIYAGATWNFTKNGYVRMDEQYAVDVLNTFYVDGKHTIPIDDKTWLTLGAQYYPQRSVGAAQIGSFSTYGLGLQGAVGYGPVGVQLYYTQTGKGFDTQNPFGSHASYLDLMQVPFNTAGERAGAIGGNVDFAGLGVPGLSASAIYADSRDRIDDQTGAPVPNRSETDVRVDYAIGKGTPLEGHLPLLLAASGWLAADSDPIARVHQLRGQVLESALLRRQSQHLEGSLQLNAHRHAEADTGWQAAHEPLVVDPADLARLCEPAEGRIDDFGERRIVAREHDSVGLIGQQFADDRVLPLKATFGEEGNDQDVVGGQCVGPAVGKPCQRLRMIVGREHGESGSGPGGELAHHSLVGRAAHDDDPPARKVSQRMHPGAASDQQPRARNKGQWRKGDARAPLGRVRAGAAFEVDPAVDHLVDAVGRRHAAVLGAQRPDADHAGDVCDDGLAQVDRVAVWLAFSDLVGERGRLAPVADAHHARGLDVLEHAGQRPGRRLVDLSACVVGRRQDAERDQARARPGADRSCRH
jgi:hypothetical protein